MLRCCCVAAATAMAALPLAASTPCAALGSLCIEANEPGRLPLVQVSQVKCLFTARSHSNSNSLSLYCTSTDVDGHILSITPSHTKHALSLPPHGHSLSSYHVILIASLPLTISFAPLGALFAIDVPFRTDPPLGHHFGR